LEIIYTRKRISVLPTESRTPNPIFLLPQIRSSFVYFYKENGFQLEMAGSIVGRTLKSKVKNVKGILKYLNVIHQRKET
jgi:hypothetical protein